MGESVKITKEDFPATAIQEYEHKSFHNLHKLDMCKDAQEATVKVRLALSPKVKTLFNESIKTLGNVQCNSYVMKLKSLENKIQEEIDSHTKVIQKQINRLDKPAMSYREVKDTGLPLSIKLAIRDSGPTANSYRSDIEYLEVPSDYSDPATRTPLQGKAPRFPPTDKPLEIGQEVFLMMLGKENVISDFRAVMAKDNSCTISFTITYTYNQSQETVLYATKVGANYKSKEAVAGAKDASPFFQGNAEKNTYFNENESKWTIKRTPKEQAETLGDAISYLICKEFFGDVLIALIARKYKVAGSPEGAAAVFTSDNALKCLCSLLQVDYVAKNWIKSGREEAVACLFSANPAAELEAAKAKIIEDIIAWNKNIINGIEFHVNDENEFKGIGDITPLQIKFFLEFFIPYTNKINKHLEAVSTNDKRSLVDFREDIIRYKVTPVLKSVAGNVVTLVRGVYNPFKYVPKEVGDPPKGFPEIKTEFVTYLQKISKEVKAVGEARVQLGKRKVRGGAGTAERKMEEDTVAIDENPTKVLKDTIERLLPGFELYDVSGRIDTEDIYTYLFTIYDIDCKISFNEVVIEELINGFLNGDAPTMDFAEVRTMYNTLLKSQDDLAEKAEMAEEAKMAEEAEVAPLEGAEMAPLHWPEMTDLHEEVTPNRRGAKKAAKRPSAHMKRITVKQRLHNNTRKKNSAQKLQRQKNRSMRAKGQRNLRRAISHKNSLVGTPSRMAAE